LKTLAFRNPKAHNASQEFNLDTLSPTYRLLDGIPGGSSALEIASRLGLNPQIIRHAESLIERLDHDLQQIFQALQDSQRQLDEDVLKADRAREEANRIYQEAEKMKQTIERQEREDRHRYRKQWQQEFSRAQRTLQELLENLKKEKTMEQARKVRHTFSALNHLTLKQLSLADGESTRALQEGDWVEIEALGTQGILLEPPEGKKQVTIQVGSRTLKTSPQELRGISPPSLPQGSATRSRSASRTKDTVFAPSSPTRYEESIDVRGARVEETLELVELTLDRAMASQTKYVKIIHGRGTGALQSSIRQYCRSSPYIKGFRAGEPSEGGEGITIIELE